MSNTPTDAAVEIVLTPETIDPDDILDLVVRLGGRMQVSDFTLQLKNESKKYSPAGSHPLFCGMPASIKVGRGSVIPQLLTGKTLKPKFHVEPKYNTVSISGLCLGQKLHNKQVTNAFIAKKGEAIVKTLLDDWTGTVPLGHVRGATELVESTDTTYAKLEYEDKYPNDIVKYVADSADLAGIIGFDWRVAPDGLFEFFAHQSKRNYLNLDEVFDLVDYEQSALRIRNRIKIKGAREWSDPSNEDACEAQTGWTSQIGSATYIPEVWKVGAGYIRGKTPYGVETDAELAFKYAFPLQPHPIDDQTFLYFWSTMVGWANVETEEMRILAPDSDNYFYCNDPAKFVLEGIVWQKMPLGKSQEYDASKNAEGWWRKVGNPSWLVANAVQFYAKGNTVPATQGEIDIDGLYLNPVRYWHVEEDPESIAVWDEIEYSETDEELYSEHECEMRARALLENLSGIAESFTLSSKCLDYGDTPLLPCDLIHTVLPNENVNDDVVIDNVTYHVAGSAHMLEVVVEAGNLPPMYADYLYHLRARADAVAKYKSASR